MSTRDLTLPGSAGELEARLTLPTGAPGFAAVVAHPHPLYGGSMHNAVVLACDRALQAAGGGVLRFNFRGVGRSQGRHDGGPGELSDLEVAVEALCEAHPDLPLWLAGYSFGAWTILERARRRASPDAARLLALAPPLTHYDFSFMAENETPVGLVVGGSDPLTPPHEVELLAGTWRSCLALERLDGAGHDLGTATAGGDELAGALERAIGRLLAETR